MSARNWMVALLAFAALLAGCGGGGGGGGGKEPAAKSSGPPVARESLAAAAKRLERTLPHGDCKALGLLMLHSVPRQSEPTTPPTAAECRFIKTESRNELRGYRLTRARQFGSTGLTEGTGARHRSGEVVGIVWVLDTDGSWKAVFDAIFRPQIGFPPAYGPRSGANARSFVTAVSRGDCDGFWRLLNVASRFVRAQNGAKQRFCSGLPRLYRNRRSAFPDLKADPSARPRELGQTRDLGFYGLQLRSGRYLALVLSGRLGNIADAEQKQHDNPTVLEFVTQRRPAE